MAEGSKFFWPACGCGCAVLLGLSIALITVGGFLATQNTRIMADPEAIHQKALEYLKATALPSDYEAQVAMSIPLLAKVIILQGDEAQFTYLRDLSTEADLTAAFTDDESFDREIRRAGLYVRDDQTLLARDTFRSGQAEVRYILLEGPLDFDVTANSFFDFDLGEMVSGQDDVDEEIGAVVLTRCSAHEKPLLGLWKGPRSHSTAGETSDVEDVSAEQSALRDVITQFGFCSK